jgi:hypothetical protein
MPAGELLAVTFSNSPVQKSGPQTLSITVFFQSSTVDLEPKPYGNLSSVCVASSFFPSARNACNLADHQSKPVRNWLRTVQNAALYCLAARMRARMTARVATKFFFFACVSRHQSGQSMGRSVNSSVKITKAAQ